MKILSSFIKIAISPPGNNHFYIIFNYSVTHLKGLHFNKCTGLWKSSLMRKS